MNYYPHRNSRKMAICCPTMPSPVADSPVMLNARAHHPVIAQNITFVEK